MKISKNYEKDDKITEKPVISTEFYALIEAIDNLANEIKRFNTK